MTKSYNSCVYLLLLFLLMTGAAGYSQTLSPERAMVKVDATNLSIRVIIKDIEKQTGYVFNYDENEVDLNQKISIRLRASLRQTLLAISGNSDLGFQITGNTIAIRKALLREKQSSRMISGLLTEARTGLPIPGVNIYKKGTVQGAVTNVEGEFTFKLNGADLENILLEFKYIGMKTRTERVGNQSFFRIALEDDVMGMDEVVVTSSYTKEKRREEVVGSIAQLNPGQLQVQRPIESFDKMLEGLVAGVYVETNTELNTPVKINIRGQGSLPQFGTSRTTSSQPLFVIDGIPSYEQQRGTESSVFNGEDYQNPLANINPDDISSVSILKDATASALYGANAANGVIIITTKKGQSGKTSVNVNYDTGVSSFINEFKWLSGPQYYSLLRETYVNGGMSVAAASLAAGSPTINTDWFDLTNRNAVYHNSGVNVSGGSGPTNFRFSAGYRNQQSSSLGNDLSKVYMRLNLNHEFSEKFKVGFNISPTLSRSNALSVFGAVTLPPNLAPYNPDGSFADLQGVPNPLAVLSQNENSNKGLQVMANANASYRINNEITISGTLGADAYQNKQTKYLSAQNATGRNLNGSLAIYDRNYIGYIGFLQGAYDKTFGSHTINFLIGTQVEDKDTELLRGNGTGFTFERLRTLSAASNMGSASAKSSDATVSYYSQLGYDLNKKYFANFNARIDKSSMFGGDKQLAFNGSAGLAWLLSKEDFLKDSKAINMLKLRATYGSTGNSRIGSYAARGLYTFGTATGSTYNGNIISTPESSAAPNPELGWERNNKLNFAVDISLFNKVNLTAEYYRNTIHDLISSVYVPLESGFNTISANTGKMRNTGFELSINAPLMDKRNFGWNLSYNLGWNKNRMIEFNNGYAGLYSVNTLASGIVIGESASAIYGYHWAGVNPESGASQYSYVGNLLSGAEINRMPLVNTTVIGDRLPDFQGGLINQFRIYGFDFSFNILYSYGASQLLGYANESDGLNLQHRNQSVNLLDRWQRPNDVTNIPRLLITNTSAVRNSTRYLYDLSYLKLSNVSLNYRLPVQLTKALRLSNTSVFANATNLFYVYKDAGTKGRNGVAENRFVYPETMSLTAGVRIGF